MKTRSNVGIIGADHRAEALSEGRFPVLRFRVAAWAPAPGAEAATVAPYAAAAGAELCREWQEVVQNPTLPAVVVLGGSPGVREAVVGALAAGKTVLCLAPMAGSLAELEEISGAQKARGALLLCPGEIRYTPAGSYAVQTARSGQLGDLHSAFVTLRTGRVSALGLEHLLTEGLDFVLALTDAPVQRVHAVAAADLTTVIVRFTDGLVATVDLSRTLPATLPEAGAPEAEIEVVGSRQMVRLEPYRTAVRILGSASASLRSIMDDPVRAMLAGVAEVLDGKAPHSDELARLRRLLELRGAVQAAAAGGLGTWHASEA